jgi:hypothetical protein
LHLVVSDRLQIHDDTLGVSDKLRGWIRDGKINVILHADIIPLPMFNSNVIAAHLHQIPELASYFVKFDDDVMLRQPMKKMNFF